MAYKTDDSRLIVDSCTHCYLAPGLRLYQGIAFLVLSIANRRIHVLYELLLGQRRINLAYDLFIGEVL
jgi:hypothetical protein